MEISAQFMPGDLPVFIDSVRKAEEAATPVLPRRRPAPLAERLRVYGARARRDRADPVRDGGDESVHAPPVGARQRSRDAGGDLSGAGDPRYRARRQPVRTLGKKQVATDRMRDIVPMLRDLMAGRSVDVDGHEARILWASEPDVDPHGGERASEPSTRRGAGRHRDDAGGRQSGSLPVGRRAGARGAEAAGRDPADVEITLYTAMVVSDDLDYARSQTKWAAACARNHLADVARRVPDHGMPEPIMRLVNMPESDYDYAGHLDPSVERGEFPTQVLDDFAFNGPPERIWRCWRRSRRSESTRSPRAT